MERQLPPPRGSGFFRRQSLSSYLLLMGHLLGFSVPRSSRSYNALVCFFMGSNVGSYCCISRVSAVSMCDTTKKGGVR